MRSVPDTKARPNEAPTRLVTTPKIPIGYLVLKNLVMSSFFAVVHVIRFQVTDLVLLVPGIV
jgi:hypothetical protein